jgi:hypothetical protein
VAILISFIFAFIGLAVIACCYYYSIVNQGKDTERAELARAHKIIMDLAEAYLESDCDRKIKRVRDSREQVLSYHRDVKAGETVSVSNTSIVLAFNRSSSKEGLKTSSTQ